MYSIDKYIHETHFIRKRPDGLTALTINYIILQFAAGMAGSFGVLFIFHLGKDLFQGLTFAVAFFCLQRTVVGIVMPFVAVVVSRIGYRRTMLVGLICMALKYLSLIFVTSNLLWPLIPALVLGGISIPAYYLAYHALFIDDNDDAKLGEQIGFMAMLGGVAGAVSPFLSGLIIDSFDFPVMFGLAMVLMLVSVVPLLLMDHHKKHAGNYSFKKVKKLFVQYPDVFWSNFAWHFENAFQGLF
ncbi:MFS transporter, partial [Patescibacteria group bacterium]|nr:MFS transporter [Patescibacteria group bacterium]